MRKRLLYIAYHFPPVGGSGVQRALKFVKYLLQLCKHDGNSWHVGCWFLRQHS